MAQSFQTRARTFFGQKVEADRFTRLENIVEGLVFYAFVVVLTLRLVFRVQTLTEMIFMDALFVYIIIIAPILHRNSAKDVGIGNIRRLKEDLFTRNQPGAIATAVVILALSVLVFPLFLGQFGAVLELVPVIGQVNLIIAHNIPVLQVPVAIAEYVLFQVLIAIVFVRKDNIWQSLRSMLVPVIALLCVMIAMSAVSGYLFHMKGTVLDFFAIWYGYTFWGILQQIPFLVYFSMRFRIGFPAGKKADIANMLLLAFLFCLYHAPQWPLVIIAFLFELIVARSFLSERNRNLFVAGILHGFFGTFALFFTGIYIMVTFIH
jgi:hypothetical protein